MTQFPILLDQLVQFFFILFIGYLAASRQVIKELYLPELSRIVMKIILPAYIFTSMLTGTTIDKLIIGIPVLFLSIAIYAIFIFTFILLAKVCKLSEEIRNVYQALFIFGNTAIVAMPLINVMYPKDGIMYLALFAIIDQFIFWTYGIWLTSNKQQQMKINVRNFTNPSLLAVILAILFILIGVQLPTVLQNTLNTVGRASTAICMIYLGSLFYFSNWKKVFRKKEIYVGIAFKMILLPIIISIMMQKIGLSPTMRETMVILSALPTMTVVPMLVNHNSEAKEYAIGGTLFTMACSLITLPLVMYLVI